MATTTTIPATELQSWQQAFNTYPPPIVRKLGQQLRHGADENLAQLRSLVAGSYRDLLGTAETIIQMDAEAANFELRLAEIGHKCTSESVERVFANVNLREEKQRKGRVALVKKRVFENSLREVRRVVASRGDPLLAGNLFVLARLLVDGDASSLQRKTLARRRVKVLEFLERTMAGSDCINALCAFALISNTPPKEVLRFFLAVRSKVLREECERVVGMLAVYKNTMTDVRDIFPDKISRALAELARVPIWDDKRLDTTDRDILEPWISDEIKTFTPWIKHNGLEPKDVRKSLETFAAEVRKAIIEAVGHRVATLNVLRTLKLREEVMQSYLSITGEGVRELREIFAQRVSNLVHERTSSVLVVLEALAVPPTSSNIDLWDSRPERQEVEARRLGRNSTITSFTFALDEWKREVESLGKIVHRMRRMRWDVDLDLDHEEDDAKDADAVQSALNSSLAEVKPAVYSWLTKKCEDGSDPAVMLRLLREAMKRISSDQTQLVKKLHLQLATRIIDHIPTGQCVKGLRQLFQGAESLWENGSPVQPAPSTFKWLLDIQRAAKDLGTDLWTPGAVKVLKGELAATLSAALGDGFEANPQNTFDVKYLEIILGPFGLEVEGSQKIDKAVEAYWKRTFLLFGILAS
ncbi:hypothetical protein K470DRAFT_131163 [Piedraia hortae CBS 480.64]|uniref:Conserved oligomeric Golgi complex subunit 1 n=1 Tax=Piedraia hortae CBS 480.64 TaxID=1314780 RepID=A0A6A7BU24_9PEZI|nr:hypothetical protein K470DRAFT_131163 [Piedraia hortae CBS 480.64]